MIQALGMPIQWGPLAWRVQWPEDMPALDSLMKRLGFVKLARYGLVLTPEGRILSLRPAVLEDGLGGRVVGWQDGDLAAMELQKWEPARPAPSTAVAPRVAMAPPRVPVPRNVVPERSAAIAAPPPPPMAVISAPAPVAPPVEVAPAPQVEEDDWEWTIAIARARAAAEEVEETAVSVRAPVLPAAIPAPPRFVPARTQAMAAVARDPMKTDSWPKTEPLASIDYEDYTNPAHDVVRVARVLTPGPQPTVTPVVLPIPAPAPTPSEALPVVRATARPGTQPATIIPIPKLPSVRSTERDSGRTSNIQAVVRPTAAQAAPVSPRRFAKGTGEVGQTTAVTLAAAPPPIRSGEDTMPAYSLGEQTSRTLAVGDRTTPGIALPSIKHRLAR